MGGNSLVFFPAVVKDFELVEPVSEGNNPDDDKEPVNQIGRPPIFHIPEKIERPEQVVNE